MIPKAGGRASAAACAVGLILGWLPGGGAAPASGPASGQETRQMATITLTPADSGKTVEVRAGDAIVVRLEENPTTGYRWAAEPGGDQIVALESSDYVSPGAAVGGGGERVFTFRARQAGSAPIRLKLWREWEGQGSIARTFTVTVRVQP
jgi:inhibitor of cysteine peptidase